jgi:very-short-patch-repair endonuclease
MDWRKNPISPQTVKRARRLRREPPFPESLLWSRLRTRQLGGLYFRRQHPVGKYIVDFYCAAAKLVIELDGESHDDRARYDEQRTGFLEAAGLRVIRFTDDEVLKSLENVVFVIARECGLEV